MTREKRREEKKWPAGPGGGVYFVAGAAGAADAAVAV